MTTLLTTVGRYQYLRLPFGVVRAIDNYCRQVADSFNDIPNTRRVSEDILIFSMTWKEHVEAVGQLFASEHDASLNTKKLKFAQQTVKFGGYMDSETTSYRIQNLPTLSGNSRRQGTIPTSGILRALPAGR